MNLKNIMQTLHQIVDDGATSIDPVVFVEEVTSPDKPSGGMNIVAIAGEFNDASAKNAALFSIGQLFKKENKKVQTVALVSEAWMKSFSRAEYEKGVNAPATYPDKIEIVLVLSMDITGFCQMDGYIISRDSDGKIVLGKHLDTQYTEADSGLLAQFYKGYGKFYKQSVN